jgi:hypothetical protein
VLDVDSLSTVAEFMCARGIGRLRCTCTSLRRLTFRHVSLHEVGFDDDLALRCHRTMSCRPGGTAYYAGATIVGVFVAPPGTCCARLVVVSDDCTVTCLAGDETLFHCWSLRAGEGYGGPLSTALCNSCDASGGNLYLSTTTGTYHVDISIGVHNDARWSGGIPPYNRVRHIRAFANTDRYSGTGTPSFVVITYGGTIVKYRQELSGEWRALTQIENCPWISLPPLVTCEDVLIFFAPVGPGIGLFGNAVGYPQVLFMVPPGAFPTQLVGSRDGQLLVVCDDGCCYGVDPRRVIDKDCTRYKGRYDIGADRQYTFLHCAYGPSSVLLMGAEGSVVIRSNGEVSPGRVTDNAEGILYTDRACFVWRLGGCLECVYCDKKIA